MTLDVALCHPSSGAWRHSVERETAMFASRTKESQKRTEGLSHRKSPRRSAAATKAETKDAGLPDTNRRDSHKSGESPPLQTAKPAGLKPGLYKYKGEKAGRSVRFRKPVRNAPVETTGVQRAHKKRERWRAPVAKAASSRRTPKAPPPDRSRGRRQTQMTGVGVWAGC
jgi:hypothetical protein